MKRAVQHFSHYSHAVSNSRRPGGAGSALGFVRRRRVAPVDELTGFTAVPRLGVAGVHAPAAELTSLRASAAHARLGRVKRAYQSFGFGCACGVCGSSDHRFQIFHSAWHVPVKRADGHDFADEAHQVDLSDGDLRAGAPLLSRLCPSLHRHGQVYCKPVGADAIGVPNHVVRGSDGVFVAFRVAKLVMLRTFAPELEREPWVFLHAVAFVVAYSQINLRISVALRYGGLVPFDRLLHVRRVVPETVLVT